MEAYYIGTQQIIIIIIRSMLVLKCMVCYKNWGFYKINGSTLYMYSTVLTPVGCGMTR